MSPSDFKAVIFDLDGTLVNTAFLHKEAWEKALARLGIKSSVDVTLLLGRRTAEIAKVLAGKRWEELVRIKNEEFVKLVEEAAGALPCAKEIVAQLKSQGKKVAIVTSSNRVSALKVIEKVGINPDCLITGDDVTKGKPDPEPVVKALQCLGVSPQEAIAVGDTAADLMAYKACGIKAIYLVKSGVPVNDEVVKSTGTVKLNDLCDFMKVINGAEGGI